MRTKNSSGSQIAPGPRGFDAFRFYRDLDRDSYRALSGLKSTYGSVVEVDARVGPRMTLLIGHDANRFVLSEAKSDLLFAKAYRGLAPAGGPTALIVSDGPDHDRRRALVQPAFRPRTIDGQVAAIRDEAVRVIDQLPANGIVDLYPRYRRAVRRAVIRVLFGDYLRERADEIGEILEVPLEFVNRLPQRQWKINLPGTAYHRTLKARKTCDGIIDVEVERRRVQNGTAALPEHDVLDMLMAGEDGDSLTQAELRDQVVSLVAAGYDTTSSAMAWTLYEAMIRPDVWERLAHSEEPERDPYVLAVVSEALRLHPSAVIAARYAATDVEFEGFRIRKGNLVAYSPFLTHRDPSLWPRPDSFEPDRWDVRPDPYSFVTFGGGSRRCIGFGLATTELAIFLTEAARRVQFRPVSGTPPRPKGIASAHPRDGLLVKVTKR